jgi:hypothetical protein
MADVTITGLPNAATLTGTERVPMDQGGATVDAQASAIAGLATKTTVGLGNCDNTSDANKPVSTATQTALDGKAPTGPIGSSGLTMTAGILGRESGTGAPQIYSIGSGLAIVGGALVVTGVGGGGYPSLSMPTGFSVSGSRSVSCDANVTISVGGSCSVTLESLGQKPNGFFCGGPVLDKRLHAWIKRREALEVSGVCLAQCFRNLGERLPRTGSNVKGKPKTLLRLLQVAGASRQSRQRGPQFLVGHCSGH